MIPAPPNSALKFLRWFCHEDYIEEIEGDLIELFEIQYQSSPSRARRKFNWSVVKYFRPEFMKVFSSSQYSNTTTMVKNDLKIAWRHLWKQKLYSSIKISGFALGIAACLLIALFVKDELRYDQHYRDKHNIFRVINQYTNNGMLDEWVWFPAATANVLVSDFPEIEKSGRLLNSELFGAGTNEFRRIESSRTFHESGFVYVDQGLLDILEIEFVAGDPTSALKEPNTMVISESKALKYFPNEDPIGKTIILDNDENRSFTIKGVVRLKEASHFQYDFFMTLSEKEFWKGEQDEWNTTNYHTYVKLLPEGNKYDLEQKLTLLNKNYFIPAWKAAGDLNVEEEAKKMKFGLQAVNNIHLYNRKIHDDLTHGDIRFVWLFSTIAVFILLLAAINFINLSTAKSANRALEVGLRKTVGAGRTSLINQFLIESLLYSLLSFVLAMAFAIVILPYFNMLSAKQLSIPWNEWWFILTLLVTCITLGIISGLYPAFYLSSFKPIQTLKGNLSKGSKSSSMRSGLVIFQFTTSAILIIATFIVHRQMNFMLNKDLGFEKDQVLMIKGTNTLGNRITPFKEELLQLSAVKHVSVSDYFPVEGSKRDNNGFYKEGMQGQENAVIGQIWRTDSDYIKTFGMHLIDGRDFNKDMASDSSSIIINETMAKKFGFANPIGQRIENFGRARTIIGVVKDFHFESMKGEIRPLCFVIGNSTSTVSVKVNTEDIRQLLNDIENKWEVFSPHQKIRYSFLDERFAMMYDDVQRMGKIFTTFATLAIVVACLGLFALSTFMVEQRTKEISIRLVLGASLNNIFKLLTFNFVKLVIISIIIGAPISWYFMIEWLEDYTYRTTIGWDVFVLSSALILIISILTVSYQSVKAALISPAESLKG